MANDETISDQDFMSAILNAQAINFGYPTKDVWTDEDYADFMKAKREFTMNFFEEHPITFPYEDDE